MKKIIYWFKQSNRWKHFVGGFGIGVLSNSLYCAGLAGLGVASALEFKDAQLGGKWDWIDWGITVAGVAAGFGLRALFMTLV